MVTFSGRNSQSFLVPASCHACSYKIITASSLMHDQLDAWPFFASEFRARPLQGCTAWSWARFKLSLAYKTH